MALAAREEGVTITVEEAQKVIDAIFTMYPGLVPFFAECRFRAANRPEYDEPSPRWLCGAFGRFRRFPFTTDREMLGDFERQAMNYPLQNLVADAVSRAVDNLMTYRRRHKLGFKIGLQIHDALLFLVPNKEVPLFVDKVLPFCMSKSVPVYPCHLDGTPKPGTKAYYLGTDVEIARYWGVQMSPRDCWDREVPVKYAGWHASERFKAGWENHKLGPQVWLEATERLHPFMVSKRTKTARLKEDLYLEAVKAKKLPEPTVSLAKAIKSIKDDALAELIGF